MDYYSKYKYVSIDIRLHESSNNYEYRGYYQHGKLLCRLLLSEHSYLNSAIRREYENSLLDKFDIHTKKYYSILYQELLK